MCLVTPKPHMEVEARPTRYVGEPKDKRMYWVREKRSSPRSDEKSTIFGESPRSPLMGGGVRRRVSHSRDYDVPPPYTSTQRLPMAMPSNAGYRTGLPPPPPFPTSGMHSQPPYSRAPVMGGQGYGNGNAIQYSGPNRGHHGHMEGRGGDPYGNPQTQPRPYGGPAGHMGPVASLPPHMLPPHHGQRHNIRQVNSPASVCSIASDSQSDDSRPYHHRSRMRPRGW